MQHNLAKVRSDIQEAAMRAGRRTKDITLIGVSKTRPVEDIKLAFEQGLRHFGENRVQEALPKIETLNNLDINWHMIGSLQTNKVRHILPRVALIHSLDRWSLAKELERRAQRLDLQARCLVQVNVANEATKSGLPVEEVRDFVTDVIRECPHVAIQGLMAMAPLVENAEEVRPYFRTMRHLFVDLADLSPGCSMQHLSMGMSNDFVVAIEEGATMVRVGTAIFGGRKA